MTLRRLETDGPRRGESERERERMRGKEGGREDASSVSGVFLRPIFVYGAVREWRREGRSEGWREGGQKEGRQRRKREMKK